MKWLKTVTVWTMLALWLPVTNHCRLEQMPIFSFLACCDEEGGDAQDSDCQTDGCALVENGLYRIEGDQIQVVLPVFTLVDFLSPPAEGFGAGHEFIGKVLPDSGPPDLPPSWQFSLRAAAPPRAPTLVS